MPSNVYIGTDIVEVSRIRDLIDTHPKRFIERTYTNNEQSYCEKKADSSIHFAGRFAAKEAIKKALMSSGVSDPINWTAMEIVSDSNGAPVVVLHGEVISKINCKVSISHTDTIAIATAVIQV